MFEIYIVCKSGLANMPMVLVRNYRGVSGRVGFVVGLLCLITFNLLLLIIFIKNIKKQRRND